MPKPALIAIIIAIGTLITVKQLKNKMKKDAVLSAVSAVLLSILATFIYDAILLPLMVNSEDNKSNFAVSGDQNTIVNGNNNVVNTGDTYYIIATDDLKRFKEVHAEAYEEVPSSKKSSNPIVTDTDETDFPAFSVVEDGGNLLVHVEEGSLIDISNVTLLIGNHYEIEEGGTYFDTIFCSYPTDNVRAIIEPGEYHIVAIASDHSIEHVLGSAIFTISSLEDLIEVSITLQ